MEDTISTDEQDNEVNADQDSRHGGTPVSHDAIVHDVVPVFTCQDLKQTEYQTLERHCGSKHLAYHMNDKLTWKTVIRAWGKLSKLLRLTYSSGKLNFPPKTCMPSRAKMTIKRKRSSSREAIERTEFKSDATRLLSDVQYLKIMHSSDKFLCKHTRLVLNGGIENHVPGYFDETQQPNTTQYGDPHDRHYIHVNKNELQDPHRHHKAVETVKEGYEVRRQPHCVHL